MAEKKSNLINGQQLVRNVFWNLLGTGAPLLVAIVAIPILIQEMGLERFGVLTIAWMVVGYFSLFDLGLGRALTKLVSEKLGNGIDDDVPALIWTAMLLMGALGLLGMLFVMAGSAWLVGDILSIPPELQSETLVAFYLLAASIPIVISSTGLRGVLEAYQRFDIVNAVRIPLGIFTFLGPVLVLPFSNSLIPVVGVLVVARLISWCAYVVSCRYIQPNLRRSVNIDRAMIRPLISFGSWMTVSNIVSPIMVYMDRFLIGSVISMAAVSYYATPYEVVTKLLIVPSALMGVMFPAFAAVYEHNKPRVVYFYGRTVSYVFLALYPAVLIIVTFSYEGISLWLGVDFADNSSLVLKFLAIGVFFNSLANVPFGLIQSAGRPDLTAKLHLVELPIYVLVLWLLMDSYGIEGVAAAWMFRVALDASVLFITSNRLLFIPLSSHFRSIFIMFSALLFLGVGAVISDISTKFIFLSLTFLGFSVITWLWLLNIQEKEKIRSCIKNISAI